jgi:hypothetical protein
LDLQFRNGERLVSINFILILQAYEFLGKNVGGYDFSQFNQVSQDLSRIPGEFKLMSWEFITVNF